VRRTTDGEALVPGDLALPEAGDKVPADLCLLRVHGRQVQEGILTGESVAVEKRTDPVAADGARGAAARDGAGPE
jgi:P-type E1-E2 ATPase